ncbi:hypothetical protein [Mycobacterium gastri]|uniref:Uncharacterized protein n=1 Tax=Mycobacterium gastri TaxID=1777 RepID=A0A1X1VPV6_MYCGS|nr:hypothetical protein [Mycobacterium gastri]ETW26508.1 hypothetical protein MGAST_18175 [Mycobacterium gastri 'Wayne']ORV71110.1 hypothetical protein AWC07_05020 [Mycobacterium gastri]
MTRGLVIGEALAGSVEVRLPPSTAANVAAGLAKPGRVDRGLLGADRRARLRRISVDELDSPA